MNEPKSTSASTHLDITVECPYCDNYQFVTEDLKEELGYDLRSENVDREITCDNSECQKNFIVTDIQY